MRISLDSRILAQSNTGIARYVIGLVRAWGERFPDDEWIYVTHQSFDPTEFDLRECEQLLVPFVGQTLLRPIWETFLLSRALRNVSAKPDVFFSPLGAVARDGGAPSVAVIHDLAFMRYPSILPTRYRLYWNWVVKRAAEHADGIIAVSDSTKRDVMELLEVPENRIRRVHEGVDDVILTEPSSKAMAELRDRFGLPDRFLLFVGTLEPRKNILFLLEAYERLLDKHVPLVLAGGRGWLSDSIRDRLKELSPYVLPTGSLSMEELACLYRMATVFVFPSLYEGFGLPLVEAMAVGLPVIAVRSSSIPEVVGGAGILVDPGDAEGFAQAVSSVLDDADKRRDLACRSRARAGIFTWTKAAEEVREVFAGLTVVPERSSRRPRHGAA